MSWAENKWLPSDQSRSRTWRRDVPLVVAGPSVLGALLAFGTGEFVYLAYLSGQEHKWQLVPSLLVLVVGVLLIELLLA